MAFNCVSLRFWLKGAQVDPCHAMLVWRGQKAACEAGCICRRRGGWNVGIFLDECLPSHLMIQTESR